MRLYPTDGTLFPKANESKKHANPNRKTLIDSSLTLSSPKRKAALSPDQTELLNDWIDPFKTAPCCGVGFVIVAL